jgi:multicomponent Na+:H+ antiporter subunit B
MRNRGQALLNIFVLALLIAASFLVYGAVSDRSEGAGLFSAGMEKRVSARFVDKSVSRENERAAAYGASGLEEGSANIVTSIVVNYRAFDTLLEVIILFTATAGVALLAVGRGHAPYREASAIVTASVPLVNLLVFMTGAVIVLTGHLSPGGGFAGGAVIASGFLLIALAFRKPLGDALFIVLESAAGLAILAVGFLGLYFKGSFLENFLPTGRVGDFLSGGTVVVLYVLIGIKVLSEISNITIEFRGKEGA